MLTYQRSEKEMFGLILSVAKNDDRIRAVCMNGSRTNKNVPTDIFQDYDIVYIVNDLDSFICNHSWVDVFGERIVTQLPDLNDNLDISIKKSFTYLMQFCDGNRIDLNIMLIDKIDEYFKSDKLTMVLLDKDDITPSIPQPSDKDYHVKPPSAQGYFNRCNEFWWCAPYIAKGLWRNEFLFATDILNQYVRTELIYMLTIKAGISFNFCKSVGKSEKYLDKFIPHEDFETLMQTFDNSNYEKLWNSLMLTCNLFSQTAQFVADHFNFIYNKADEIRVLAWLNYVRNLSKDAKRFEVDIPS